MKLIEQLIRVELSAVKSIDTILRKIKDDAEKEELYSIRQDHLQAVTKLKPFAGSDFKETDLPFGPWAAFSSVLVTGARFFGEKASLRAMKVAEEHGINEYREAVKSEGISSQAKEMIQADLLPTQEKHLVTIDRYLQ